MSSENRKYVHIAPKTKHANNTPRKIRNRKACDLCKVKKTKCDIMDGFKNCKNCLLAEEGCTFNISIKKKTPSRGNVSTLEENLKRIERHLVKIISDSKKRGVPASNTKNYLDQDQVVNRQAINALENSSTHKKLTFLLQEDKIKLKDILNRLILPFGIQSQMNTKSDEVLVKESELIDFGLIKNPIQEHVDEEPVKLGMNDITIHDWIYKVAGISKDLSDKLLKIYFAYIHPGTPIVNKTQFLEEYRRIRPEFPFPTLILSMYLAAIKYATTCIKTGDEMPLYEDRSEAFSKELSENFVDRIWSYHKLRYIPTVASLQANIIGQIHCLNSEKRVKDWVLCFNGIQMCYDLGLHRSSEKLQLSQKEKETRRRVLWSLYVLDHWLSAESGRPLSIFEEEITEIYPSENADWDEVMDSMTDSDRHLPRFPSLDEDTAKRFQRKPIPLYQPLIQMIKLSKILGTLLKNMYTPHAKKYCSEYGSDTIVAYIDSALSSWRAGFPPLLETTSVDKIHLNDDLTHSLSMRGLISLSYYTVLILLHRPFIKKKTGEKSALSEETSLAICTSAATKILEISDLMHYHDFLLISWGYAAYPSITATSIHLFNLHNTDREKAKNIALKVCQGIKIVNKISVHSTIKGKLNSFVAECLPYFELDDCEIESDKKSESPSIFEAAICDSKKKSIEDSSTLNTAQKQKTSESLYPASPNDYSWLDELSMNFSQSRYLSEQTALDVSKEPSAFLETVDMEDLYSITQFGFNIPELQSLQHAYYNDVLRFQTPSTAEHNSLSTDSNMSHYENYTHGNSEDNTEPIINELDFDFLHTFSATPLTFQNYGNVDRNSFWGVPDHETIEYLDLNLLQKNM